MLHHLTKTAIQYVLEVSMNTNFMYQIYQWILKGSDPIHVKIRKFQKENKIVVQVMNT